MSIRSAAVRIEDEKAGTVRAVNVKEEHQMNPKTRNFK